MIVKSVKLANFRCYEKRFLECQETVTQILGENGCGKTTILEAIYLGLRGRSWRSNDEELVRRGTDSYRVEIEFFNGEKNVVFYDGRGREFLVKDKKWRRLPVKAKYPVVLFLPDDLNMISGSPNRRREYFDRFFGQLNEKYNSSLSRYNKVLKQRKELLKKENLTEGEMFSWNILLAKYGVEVMRVWEKYCQEIQARLNGVYRSIADNEDEILMEYVTVEGRDESSYLRRLEGDFRKDVVTGHTNFGIHKDDYQFWFNGGEAEGTASRGEVRSIILALKFIEAEMVFGILGKKPVVLLDDVFSELDTTRQRCLVENFRENQVVISSVGGIG